MEENYIGQTFENYPEPEIINWCNNTQKARVEKKLEGGWIIIENRNEPVEQETNPLQQIRADIEYLSMMTGVSL